MQQYRDIIKNSLYYIMYVFVVVSYKNSDAKGTWELLTCVYCSYIFNIAQNGHESNEKCIKLTKKL